MNKLIANILRDRLSSPYLDHTCGMVQTFNRVIESDNSVAVVKRIPVTTSATFKECNTRNYQFEMIPNNKYKGLLYFEDGGISPTTISGKPAFISKLRAVVWLNTVLISGQPDMILASSIMADMVAKLNGNPFNEKPFNRISFKVTSIPVQDRSIFNKYDYDENATQYLMAPYDFFAIDILATFFVNSNCLDDITIKTPDPCTAY